MLKRLQLCPVRPLPSEQTLGGFLQEGQRPSGALLNHWGAKQRPSPREVRKERSPLRIVPEG